MGKYFAVLLIVVACTAQRCASACCEALWTQHGSSCYRIIGSPANWQDAGTACRNYEAELASIHDDEENNFVYDLWRTQTRSPSTGFWIGLNDLNTEGVYVWSDNSDLTYSNWASGEPNNEKNREDCVHSSHSSRRWNDKECSSGLSYVCKKALE